MNRRDFLNLSAGSAVAALAPLPRMAVASAAAPKRLYVWAVAMAHAGNPISHATLNQALKVSPSQARVLMDRLLARGVIHPPNAAGIAKAVRPAFQGAGMAPSVATKVQAAKGGDVSAKAAENIAKRLDDGEISGVEPDMQSGGSQVDSDEGETSASPVPPLH